MLSTITSRFLTPNLPHNKCGQYGQKFTQTPTVPIFTTVTYSYTEPHYGNIMYIESPKSVNKNGKYGVEVHLRRFSRNSRLLNNFLVNKCLTEFHEKKRKTVQSLIPGHRQTDWWTDVVKEFKWQDMIWNMYRLYITSVPATSLYLPRHLKAHTSAIIACTGKTLPVVPSNDFSRPPWKMES